MTKSNETSKNKGSKKADELEAFKEFIKKRRTQNEALKKIMDKLNSASNNNQ